MAQFSVDTHLFRELGELLVGRDSTALVELIKNAYDADATEVTVSGFGLENAAAGIITITDNGNGMTADEFTRGFLRIASRQKEQGDRRSARFLRRFTGAKGVGRLAAHKLAREIEVVSVSYQTGSDDRLSGVDARIDWDRVEEKETLAEVTGEDTVRVVAVSAPPGSHHGTAITMRRLRRAWTAQERGRFMEEVQTFEPSPILTEPLLARVVPAGLMVPTLAVRDSERGGAWKVKLEGAFEPGEPYWLNLAEAADWIIEIDASTPRVRFAITPAGSTARTLEDSSAREFEMPHPDAANGPFFQARILARDGQAWQAANRGVRVFMEGFRVLPYGESGNDWLSIDRDVTLRSNKLVLPESMGEARENEGLNMRPNRQYSGGVFLLQNKAPTLRMLVNREGFVPEGGYSHLESIVRTGVNLSVRVRAAVQQAFSLDKRLIEMSSVPGREFIEPPLPRTDRHAVELARGAHKLARQARENLAANDYRAAQATVAQFIETTEALAAVQADTVSEHALIRVLAAVGTQLSAFVHEIQGLLDMAQGLEDALDQIRSDPSITPSMRRQIASVVGVAGTLRRTLERQASYLLDVVTPDARRRRSRQSFKERFGSALKLVLPRIERSSIIVENELPAELKSPPMFPAELAMVFTNLLTNATKAAGDEGRIRVSAVQRPDGKVAVRMENTGVVVLPRHGERWFTPFESTTITVDPILGQGMGLGLPITRKMLEEYGAEIRFVEPSQGYATAVEATFPG